MILVARHISKIDPSSLMVTTDDPDTANPVAGHCEFPSLYMLRNS
jgi:hypothetical protein